MPNFDISASSAYQTRRMFVDDSTKVTALRAYVGYHHNVSLDLLDYTKPIWLVENAGNNGIVGFYNGEVEDDVRAAYAKEAGFDSLETFLAWERAFDREFPPYPGMTESEWEERENDEVATIDIALVCIHAE